MLSDSINPHQTGVSESLIRRGRGQLAPQGKLAIFAIFLHFRQQKRHQGTLGKQRWTLIESRTSHGPSMDPTGPLKWTSWFSRKIQAKIPFVHYTLSSPSKHFGTLFLVILELYQGPEDPPRPSWTPKWTPKGILRGGPQGGIFFLASCEPRLRHQYFLWSIEDKRPISPLKHLLI